MVHADMVQGSMPKEVELFHLTELFKVLGDPTRVRLMFLLFEQERCVGALAGLLQVTESAVSHQLRVLKANHLVQNRREGKNIYYFLSDHHVRKIIATGREHICEKEF